MAARWHQRSVGGRRSGGAPFVVMVKAAEVRHLDNRAAGWQVGRARHGRVLVERQVRAPLVIVGEVLLEMVA